MRLIHTFREFVRRLMTSLASFLSPAFVEIEVLGVSLVVVTEVFVNFATGRVVVVHGLPWNQPSAGPCACISALVVNCCFIFQSVVIHTRETFDEMKKTGVRQAASNHPKAFIKPHSVDNKGFSLPMADRIPEITRDELILGRMLPSWLHGNPAPIAVFAGDQKYSVEFGLIDDIETIRDGKEAHSAGGITARVRIV